MAKLAMEAAELLFEMTAMGDAGDGVREMVQKAKQLQVFTLAAAPISSLLALTIRKRGALLTSC